jgi:hypothetical protein
LIDFTTTLKESRDCFLGGFWGKASHPDRLAILRLLPLWHGPVFAYAIGFAGLVFCIIQTNGYAFDRSACQLDRFVNSFGFEKLHMPKLAIL